MMKTKIISILIFLFTFSIPFSIAAGSDENNTRHEVVKPYRGIIVNGNILVVLTKDSTQSFAVEAGNDDAASLSSHVKNNALFLNRGSNTSIEPITVYVSCCELKSIETYGGARISNTGILHVKNIYLYVHESGTIQLNLKADKVAANVRKNGKIRLKGDWDHTNISVKGNGKVMLTQMN